MDLNPIFTGISSFRAPDGEGGELKLFELCGVRLVHGWLADPASLEYPTIAKAQDYDKYVYHSAYIVIYCIDQYLLMQCT